jgi:hypothetical protein
MELRFSRVHQPQHALCPHALATRGNCSRA